MKIIDENGAAIETPDLTLGYLVGSTEEVTHPAQSALCHPGRVENLQNQTPPAAQRR